MENKAELPGRYIREFPIYYGWVVWFGALITLMTTFPGQSFTVSLFFDYFIDEFDLSRTTISTLYGGGTFVASLTLTWVGRRIDQHGYRFMGTSVAILFALALFYMSLVIHPVMLLLGFVFIRGLGQGSLGIIGSTAVAEWFGKRRGRMVGLATVGFFLGQTLYLPFLETLLENNDWRDVWRILAIGVGTVMLPLIWLLIREEPERYGLVMDGGKKQTEAVKIPDPIQEVNWTLQEARRTPLFWVYLVAQMLPPMLITGMVIHSVSIFEGLGYSRRVVAETYGMIGAVTAVFAILGGFIIDRFAPGKVIAWSLGSLAIALGLTTIMTESWLLTIYAIMFATTMGFGNVITGTVWTNIFGRGSQGAIRGFVVTGAVIGTSIGPILFGTIFDLTGQYDIALLIGATLCVIFGGLAIWVKPPNHDDYVERITRNA